jgi:hypothetical protein
MIGLAAVGPARAGGASLGVADAYSLRARGVDAPGWNPATLAWSSGLEVRIASVAGSVHNNSFSVGDYGHWNGAVLDEADKIAILDRIPGDLFRGGFEAVVDGPGVAWRGWAVTTSGHTTGSAVMPKEYGRLVFFGNDPETTYDLAGADGDGIGWSEMTLSRGGLLGTLTVAGIPLDVAGGLNVKLLRGWVYGEVTHAEGRLTTTMEGIDGDQRLAERTAEGGNGYAGDLGLAARTGVWRFGVGLRDLVSRLSWTRRPRVYLQHTWATNLDLGDLEGDEEDDLVNSEETTLVIPSFTTTLPVELTVAAARDWRRADWEVDYRQGFSNRSGVSTAPRVALGVSRRVRSFCELRGGLAFGGVDGPVLAVGTGLAWRALRVDFGIATARGVDFTSPRGIQSGLSLGLKWDGARIDPPTSRSK